MKAIFTGLVAGAFLCGCSMQAENPVESSIQQPVEQQKEKDMETLHDFQSRTLEGENFDFSQLKGKRVLIVNTASECGYTPQYEGLQQLYEEYGGDDFMVVAFPSNDFGAQEPGSNEEIKEFCRKNYGVTFPVMDKTEVTGEDKHPVYQWLTDKERNGRKEIEVQWNFNKFLIDEDGKWYAYFPSDVKPMDERIVRFAKGHRIENN